MGFFSKLNDFANNNPIVRPTKWFLSDKYHRFIFRGVKKSENKTFYRILGMQRTGNHAIINWIMNQLQGGLSFCNDLNLDQRPENSPTRKSKYSFAAQQTLIVSYEDKYALDWDTSYSEDFFGKSARKYYAVILRDPFNLFASRYVWTFAQGALFREDMNYRSQIINIWKTHAKCFLAFEKSYNPDNDIIKLGINYSRWVLDMEYRKELSQRLGLKFTENKLDEVKNYGGGSSFEGLDNSNTDRKKYLERFTSLTEDDNFKSIFQDSEILDLSQEIFGHINKSELLLK